MTKILYDYLSRTGRFPDEHFSFYYVKELKKTLETFAHKEFQQIMELMLEAYYGGRQIFVMGNGGSGTTASHFACDINKGVSHRLQKKFKVICLNDNIPIMLAYANDIDYADVFREQLKNFFKPGDVVIGFSGSGNSENVLRAIDFGRKNNGRTIGICGYRGGKLADMVDVPLVVSSEDMQKIEDVHMILVHMLMQALCSILHAQ